MSASELYTKGARIWMPDATEVWRAAELLEDFKAIPCKLKILYEEAENSEYQPMHRLYKAPERESFLEIKDKKKLPHLRNPEILIGENDLTSLSYLNEPEVLYNLKVRFVEQNTIYTYCGIVLVAINPYDSLDIYGNETIFAYSGQDMGAMDPHIYAVAEEAFKRMTRFEQDQSIIVSGESGAGKTVSAKYAMRYFATVGGSQAETQVEKKVLASNPIMEAIGNAKTTRNDNSSRFGKYLEISFNKKNEIIGANMRTYLLEKSRVVFQAKEERNYHIFYQMCASRNLPELKKFQLGAPEDFNYTKQGENSLIDGVDDAEEFQNTREAMRLLGLQEKDQMMIFQILSALLHFGNVQIKEKDAESSEIPSKDKSINTACKLLGIEESQMRMWLCNRKFTTVGEVLTKPLTASQASFSQDALSKCIYSKLFDWIVVQVNKVLHSQTKQNRFIGVLDIYGFETFEVNSFEQFCINYANEKLQQIFNMHVFKLEQEEYVKEEIEWSFIDFYDNQPCIDLIEAKLGILDLLDEECKLPKGSDANWCQKLYGKHSKAEHFDKPRMSNMAFSIYHFADKVTYQADGFLEKNRDTVLEEQINILKASEYELVAELFTEPVLEKDQKQKPGGKVKALQKGPPGSNKQMKKTVGSQFRDSLYLLMETLNSTSPHYIRCIKPNDEKEAFEFEPKRVVEQLRACGVLETIRISAAGFPSRWTYPEFFQRYRVLARSQDINRKDHGKTCQNVLTKLIQDPDKYRFGKTKIFFRAGQVAYLEKLRADKLRACGVMIQKHVRGYLVKKQYQKLRRTAMLIQRYGRGLLARRHAQWLREMAAATKIQKVWRGYKTRNGYNNVQRSVKRIQACIRGYFGRREFQRRLYEHKTKIIQCHIRTYLARKQFKTVLYGVTKIQGHFKRRKAKAELRQLKIEAKSMEHMQNVNKGLENKIIQLQQKLDQKVKQVKDYKYQEGQLKSLETEVQKLRGSNEIAEKASNRITELEEELRSLRIELEREKEEKKDVISEKELMRQKYEQELQSSNTENTKLKEELDAANRRLQLKEQVKSNEGKDNKQLEAAYQQLQAEMESERQHHQRLVKEHNRLLQRFENMQGEMQVLTSPLGHKRTPSDISMISLESVTSSVSPEEKKDGEEGEKEDQGYGTEKKKRPAPTPPSALSIEKAITDSTAAKESEKQQQKEQPKQPTQHVQVASDLDVGLLLKLQTKVKVLERERDLLRKKIEDLEEEGPVKPGITNDSAFESLKDNNKKNRSLLTESKAYDSLKMQELENENDKLKREVSKLMTSIASNTNFDAKGRKISPAGKEFLGKLKRRSSARLPGDGAKVVHGTLNRRLIIPDNLKRRNFIGRAMNPLRRSFSVNERKSREKNLANGRKSATLKRSVSAKQLEDIDDSLENTPEEPQDLGSQSLRGAPKGMRNLNRFWKSSSAIVEEEEEKRKGFFRKAFRIGKKQKTTKKVPIDQFEAMSDELERRREECLQLRALLAEKSISTHSIAKQSYGGEDDLVNEDNELTMAYKSQRDIIRLFRRGDDNRTLPSIAKQLYGGEDNLGNEDNELKMGLYLSYIFRLLEDQLQKAEKDLKKRETDYTNEIHELQKENDKQQKIIAKSLSLTTEAKIEATMQHEITRLTAENLDLREIIDKKDLEIKKLKKMIKHYAKRLKDGEAAEIQAELEKEEAKSVENVATIKHRERNYMGMLEYKKENEAQLIKTIITDLKPKVAAGLLPGLPAYILFMCVRHTDYVNDDEKVRSLLTSTINGVKKVVKKHHDDLDRVTLWLANTCRFLHTLKQYSGEKAFSQENTPRQNEHCLRNFDLAEYRQVFSDLAVWIYQTLIKLMEATIQPSIVAAVLEHEAIAGLSGSKPSGMRGRTSSRAEDTPEYSLDSLMKSLNQFVRTLSQHAVDPELVKQIFRQLYYFIGASALNNLLLRKDMCNWSKGMQIRYNLSHLEQWLRDSKLQESGAGTALEPIVQASQLLQARKTEADVESVCDMCSKLTIPQIVKILNLYTPVDEFEERVPISFIRKLQQHLKNRPNQESHLLMDLKFSFSVTFPFNPSNISLESVEIPDSLHLTGVTKL